MNNEVSDLRGLNRFLNNYFTSISSRKSGERETYMGNVIWNGQDGEDCSFSAWEKVLTLGDIYGWEAQGTNLYRWRDYKTGAVLEGRWEGIPEESGGWFEDKSWGGNYTSNDGQTMNKEDCQALALALEKALADLPDHYVDYRTIVLKHENSRSWKAPAVGDEDREPARCRCLAYFTAPDGREFLEKIIRILKQGPCALN
jgi:hypothetical protein